MPRRRCVGCGRIAPRHELLRIALKPGPSAPRGLAVLDIEGRMPGRGAYLCRAGDEDNPLEQCLELARQRRGIARTLRASVSLDPKLVESIGR